MSEDKPKRKFFFGIYKPIYLIIDAVVVFFILHFLFMIYYPVQIQNNNFEIQKDISYSQIITKINSDLVDSKWYNFGLTDTYLKIYLRFKKYDTKLKAGIYSIEDTRISRKEILEIIVSGPKQKKEKSLTFIEGWSNNEYKDYLIQQEIGDGSFIDLAFVKNYIFTYPFLQDAPNNHILQGYLFPDTYNVFDDVNDDEVIIKMLDNFQNKVTSEMLEEIKSQGKTLYDVLTMASIIEREVRTYPSKEIVSGIFWKRLEIGMPLQSDATVNYITKSGRDRSTLEDLEIDSLYNTYKYAGLPPGPICNPGLESIKSAIYPKDTDYLYFLTTDEGDIYFANTHNEHVKNKNTYLNN